MELFHQTRVYIGGWGVEGDVSPQKPWKPNWVIAPTFFFSSFFDLVRAGLCITVSTFPFQSCWRLSSDIIYSMPFDWLLLQGQHQQRPLLRHAGHQEETHC